MSSEREPKQVHPELGTLSWNEADLAYEAQIRLGDADVELAVLVDPDAWQEPMSTSTLVAQAAAVVGAVRARWDEIRTRVGDFLVESYDDEWRSGRPALSRSELLEHVRADSLAVYHDGTSELDFRDDAVDEEGLFFGHHVLVSLAANGDVTDVVI